MLRDQRGRPMHYGRPRSYRVYGLNVRSAVPLSVAAPHDGTTDVEVRRARLGAVASELRASGSCAAITPGEARLLLPRVGTFVVRAGREILVDPDPHADEQLLQLGILGPVLAVLLRQRGVLILHASAVRIDGAAVGFLGASGAGKSTMAAALISRGHQLLTDDIAAVCFDAGTPKLFPGFPQLKLWPDTLEALGECPALLPRVDPLYEKRARRITEGFSAGCGVPLGRLFVLCRGDRPGIEVLAPRDALLKLVSHSYGIRWLGLVPEAESFRQRVELAGRIPVCRLRCPTGLEHISEVVRLVEENARAG